jgi:hypothetical protein
VVLKVGNGPLNWPPPKAYEATINKHMRTLDEKALNYKGLGKNPGSVGYEAQPGIPGVPLPPSPPPPDKKPLKSAGPVKGGTYKGGTITRVGREGDKWYVQLGGNKTPVEWRP